LKEGNFDTTYISPLSLEEGIVRAHFPVVARGIPLFTADGDFLQSFKILILKFHKHMTYVEKPPRAYMRLIHMYILSEDFALVAGEESLFAGVAIRTERGKEDAVGRASEVLHA